MQDAIFKIEEGRQATPSMESASDAGQVTDSEAEQDSEEDKKDSWEQTTACIRDIFSHGICVEIKGLENRSSIEINPHYLHYKRETKHDPGPGGKRGKIINFSNKSRQRLLQMFGKILDHPSVWQDFTFPDDVMEGKTINERAKFSTKCETEFKRRIERQYPDLWGIIRREWEIRKSGKIKGEECPHLHVLWEKEGIKESDFRKVCIQLALMWVDIIKTEEYGKALMVAVNPNSYRWVVDRKMAQNYVSKYITKVEEHEKGESRGRYWMTIGDIPLEEPLIIPITDEEGDILRRLFRNKIGDKRKNVYRYLRSRYFATWFFVEAVTVKLMLGYVRNRLSNNLERYAPF
jgi:hypothetical protein